MQRSTYLKGAAVAAALAAGCGLTGTPALADIYVSGYGPGWAAGYGPYYGGYYDRGYDRGPIGLGADIAADAVGLGVGVASAPFGGWDYGPGYYGQGYYDQGYYGASDGYPGYYSYNYDVVP